MIPEEIIIQEKEYLVNVLGKKLIDSEERDDRKDGHRQLAKKYWSEEFEKAKKEHYRIEVHHINGDHSDNRVCNIVPLNRKEHSQIHYLFFDNYKNMIDEQWKVKRCVGKGELNGFYNHKHTDEIKEQIRESVKRYYRKKKEGLI